MGKFLLHWKNYYKARGNFYGLFLAAKVKHCVTKNKYGVVDEYKTFRRSTNVSENLDSKESSKMLDSDVLIAKVPLSWRKSFIHGVIIPHKLGICKCSKNVLWDDCDKLANQQKEFSADL